MPKKLNIKDPRFIIGNEQKYDAFGPWYKTHLTANPNTNILPQVSLYMPTATYNKMINEALIPLSAINSIFQTPTGKQKKNQIVKKKTEVIKQLTLGNTHNDVTEFGDWFDEKKPTVDLTRFISSYQEETRPVREVLTRNIREYVKLFTSVERKYINDAIRLKSLEKLKNCRVLFCIGDDKAKTGEARIKDTNREFVVMSMDDDDNDVSDEKKVYRKISNNGGSSKQSADANYNALVTSGDIFVLKIYISSTNSIPFPPLGHEEELEQAILNDAKHRSIDAHGASQDISSDGSYDLSSVYNTNDNLHPDNPNHFFYGTIPIMELSNVKPVTRMAVLAAVPSNILDDTTNTNLNPRTDLPTYMYYKDKNMKVLTKPDGSKMIGGGKNVYQQKGGDAFTRNKRFFYVSEKHEYADLLQLLIDWCHDFLDSSGDRTADGWSTEKANRPRCWNWEKTLKILLTIGTNVVRVYKWIEGNPVNPGNWDGGRLVWIYKGESTRLTTISNMHYLRETIFNESGSKIEFVAGIFYDYDTVKTKHDNVIQRLNNGGNDGKILEAIGLDEDNDNKDKYISRFKRVFFRGSKRVTLMTPGSETPYYLMDNQRSEYNDEIACITSFNNLNKHSGGFPCAVYINKNYGNNEIKEGHIYYNEQTGGEKMLFHDDSIIPESSKKSLDYATKNPLVKHLVNMIPYPGLANHKQSVRDCGSATELVEEILGYNRILKLGPALWKMGTSKEAIKSGVKARQAVFSAILDPATGVEFDLGLGQEYLPDFSRLVENKFFRKGSDYLPVVLMPYQYVWWPEDCEEYESDEDIDDENFTYRKGSDINLVLKGIVLLQVELYFNNDDYDDLYKHTKDVFKLNPTKKQGFAAKRSIYNKYTFHVFRASDDDDLTLENCYKAFRDALEKDGLNANQVDENVFVKKDGSIGSRAYETNKGSADNITFKSFSIIQCEKTPGVAGMCTQAMKYKRKQFNGKKIKQQAGKWKEKDYRNYFQLGFGGKGIHYPFIYNDESWGAIMMELGYQIFIELELGFEDEDPYIDGEIDKDEFLEIDNWSTSKGGKNSGICSAPGKNNNTNFEKLLELNRDQKYFSIHQFAIVTAKNFKTFGDKFRFIDSFIFKNSVMETCDTFLCKVAIMGGSKVYYYHGGNLFYFSPIKYNLAGPPTGVAVAGPTATPQTKEKILNILNTFINYFDIDFSKLVKWDTDKWNPLLENKPLVYILDGVVLPQDFIYKLYFSNRLLLIICLNIFFSFKSGSNEAYLQFGDSVDKGDIILYCLGKLCDNFAVPITNRVITFNTKEESAADKEKYKKDNHLTVPKLYTISLIYDEILKILWKNYQPIDIDYDKFVDMFNLGKGIGSITPDTVKPVEIEKLQEKTSEISQNLNALYEYTLEQFNIYATNKDDGTDNFTDKLKQEFGLNLELSSDNEFVYKMWSKTSGSLISNSQQMLLGINNYRPKVAAMRAVMVGGGKMTGGYRHFVNKDVIRGLDANQVGLLEQNDRGDPTLGMSHKAFKQAEDQYWDNEAPLGKTSTPYESKIFRESWEFIQFMSYFENFDEESPIEIMLYDIRTYIWNNIDKISGIMKINTEQNPIDLKIIFDELISKKENIEIYLEHLGLDDTFDFRNEIETIDIDKYIKHYQGSVSDIYLKFERNGIILREKQVEIMDDSFWLDKIELSGPVNIDEKIKNVPLVTECGISEYTKNNIKLIVLKKMRVAIAHLFELICVKYWNAFMRATHQNVDSTTFGGHDAALTKIRRLYKSIIRNSAITEPTVVDPNKLGVFIEDCRASGFTCLPYAWSYTNQIANYNVNRLVSFDLDRLVGMKNDIIIVVDIFGDIYFYNLKSRNVFSGGHDAYETFEKFQTLSDTSEGHLQNLNDDVNDSMYFYGTSKRHYDLRKNLKGNGVTLFKEHGIKLLTTETQNDGWNKQVEKRKLCPNQRFTDLLIEQMYVESKLPECPLCKQIIRKDSEFQTNYQIYDVEKAASTTLRDVKPIKDYNLKKDNNELQFTCDFTGEQIKSLPFKESKQYLDDLTKKWGMDKKPEEYRAAHVCYNCGLTLNVDKTLDPRDPNNLKFHNLFYPEEASSPYFESNANVGILENLKLNLRLFTDGGRPIYKIPHFITTVENQILFFIKTLKERSVDISIEELIEFIRLIKESEEIVAVIIGMNHWNPDARDFARMQMYIGGKTRKRRVHKNKKRTRKIRLSIKKRKTFKKYNIRKKKYTRKRN